jgi:hypothetical protein
MIDRVICQLCKNYLSQISFLSPQVSIQRYAFYLCMVLATITGPEDEWSTQWTVANQLHTVTYYCFIIFSQLIYRVYQKNVIQL